MGRGIPPDKESSSCICFAFPLSVLLLSAGTFLVTGTAQVQVSLIVTPTNLDGTFLLPCTVLARGDQIQLDIAARNDGAALLGLGASAAEYEGYGLALNTGQTTIQLFAQVCIPSRGCFGGLDGSGIASGPLTELPFLLGPTRSTPFF